jgi:hypothetical protein
VAVKIPTQEEEVLEVIPEAQDLITSNKVMEVKMKEAEAILIQITKVISDKEAKEVKEVKEVKEDLDKECKATIRRDKADMAKAEWGLKVDGEHNMEITGNSSIKVIARPIKVKVLIFLNKMILSVVFVEIFNIIKYVNFHKPENVQDFMLLILNKRFIE